MGARLMADTIKAKKLKTGDRLLIRGKVWTVTSCTPKKKGVWLDLQGMRPGDTFSNRVDPDRKFERAEPLHVDVKTSDGANARAQARWARPEEAGKVLKSEPKLEPHKPPKLKPDPQLGWNDDATKADTRVREILGGQLVAVQTEKGDWVVPAVDVDTIAAHLLAFHGVRFDGVSIDEARTPEAEATVDADTAVLTAYWEKARQVHDEAHAAYQAGKADLLVPHWHSVERPALAS